MANIASVLSHGILSYERAAKLAHQSVAMQPVQDKRDKVQVPGGLKLHQYANLYFHARNPMMFKRKDEAAQLCALHISTDVFSVAGTVITDCNAASEYARYLAPKQWQLLNFDDIYALDWRHPDNPSRYYQHRSRKCAEILIPHLVEPRHLVAASVTDQTVKSRLQQLGFSLPIRIDAQLFFR